LTNPSRAAHREAELRETEAERKELTIKVFLILDACKPSSGDSKTTLATLKTAE